MTRPMNPTAARLIDALTYIERTWTHMHHPLKAVKYTMGGTTGSRTSTPGDVDNGDHNRDVAPLDVLISLRGDITVILNGWCRVVMEDYDVTSTLPDGLNVPAMCEFLRRWSIQLAGHEAAQDALDEVLDCARKIREVVEPRPRETMVIGTCPIQIPDEETGRYAPCEGTVRAWLSKNKDPKCMSCGTVAVVDWWIGRMVKPEASALVTTPQLIAVIAYRLGFVPTHDRIRQWASRKQIPQSGKDANGRTLWDHAAVVDALRDNPALMRRPA